MLAFITRKIPLAIIIVAMTSAFVFAQETRGIVFRYKVDQKSESSGTEEPKIRRVSVPDIVRYVGESLSQNLDLPSGIAAGEWILASGNLPSGVAQADGGNKLTLLGTMTSSDVGSFNNIEFRYQNGNDIIVFGPFSLTVFPSIQAELSSLVTLINRPVDIEIRVSGGLGPYSITLAEGSLPPGLTISGNKIIGQASSSGLFSFAILVADKNGRSSKFNMSVLVRDELIASYGSVKAYSGQNVQFSAQVSGGVGPYNFELISKSPDIEHVTIDPNTGVMQFMASAPVYNGSIVVGVFDADENDKVINVPVEVRNPVVASPLDTSIGRMWDISHLRVPAATGGFGTLRYERIDNQMPSGVFFNDDGSFSGMAWVAGQFPFTFRVKDEYQSSDTSTVNLNVFSILMHIYGVTISLNGEPSTQSFTLPPEHMVPLQNVMDPGIEGVSYSVTGGTVTVSWDKRVSQLGTHTYRYAGQNSSGEWYGLEVVVDVVP